MIKPCERFLSEGQGYFGPRENPKAETHCNVFDWDQLRMIKVKGTAKLFPPDEDVECPVLAQFADFLSPEVTAVTVDDDGLLTGISTDPEEDDTMFIAIPSSKSWTGLDPAWTSRHTMTNLGALKTLFKFNVIEKPRRLRMAWDEMNALKSLPPHPNILPLDRIVLEDVESRVVGFTTKFIPGGTLGDNLAVPLRFEWIQQLTQLVDFLNLELGIMHQDIVPRNLLVDPDTQKLVLFDFDWVASGENGLLEGRDDVAGVVFTLYELITNETHFTSITHWDRKMDMVQSLPEWTCTRELADTDVSTLRNFLNDWVATRTKADGKVDMQRYLTAPNRITWPELPTPLDYSVPFEMGKTTDGEPWMVTGPRSRRVAMGLGQYCFRWKRPPQSRTKRWTIFTDNQT
ncbi:hypothetical protein PISL3812_09847 [Talaromyces islandicus]|uniref:Protein kinase domain-containing protein n=1 Tax=Talaromyces islandicus TaxID=28573 RepID=A0A0U1MCP2_TALIS|nr:hypothetical protein PISL3812_09847 [Talaromyces islandicus]